MKKSFLILLLIILARQSHCLQTILRLYTSESNGTIIDENHNLTQVAGFNGDFPNYILTHGFLGSGRNSWIINLKDSLLKYDPKSNVFILDWSKGSQQSNPLKYAVAVDYLNKVTVVELANYFSNFIYNGYIKVKLEWPLLPIHCIGHSLGAHVCGLTGKKLKQVERISKRTFSRITGLDPAGPGFEGELIVSDKLDRSSAVYVDIIHTSYSFGYHGVLGHRDFFPNNGQTQPGCWVSKGASDENSVNIDLSLWSRRIGMKIEREQFLRLVSSYTSADRALKIAHDSVSVMIDESNEFTIHGLFLSTRFKLSDETVANLKLKLDAPNECSHSRAHSYFIESLSDPSKFGALQCRHWKLFERGKCAACRQSVMGFFSYDYLNESVYSGPSENYFLNVAPNSPFSLSLEASSIKNGTGKGYCSEASSSKRHFYPVIEIFALALTVTFKLR